jgi:tRNA(fMet)-specific endonuclease VapC
VLEQVAILPMEPPVEEHYADIRHTLERAGTPIGPNDLLIAAHARALGLTLVTDNVREFSRVPGLLVENWLAESSGTGPVS